ncbi:MAG: phage holin family protein [Bacteroidaceae bacterium]|nr:phage holin family protein [Bacteroidaceae bacterium]
MNLHLNITQDVGHGIMIMFLCFILVLFSVVIDLFTGVQAARKCKEKLQSHILRRTVNKVISYLTVVFFGIFIDILGLCFPWYAIPYCCILCTLGVILIEGKSVIENHAKAKNPAAHVPETVMDIAEKLGKYDNLDNLRQALEILEKSSKK